MCVNKTDLILVEVVSKDGVHYKTKNRVINIYINVIFH